MPSGNAIYTYTGKEPSVTIQGHEFVKDQPSLVRDNGVIAVLEGRKDFEQPSPAEPVSVSRDLEEVYAAHPEIDPRATRAIPAKPKGKAK